MFCFDDSGNYDLVCHSACQHRISHRVQLAEECHRLPLGYFDRADSRETLNLKFRSSGWRTSSLFAMSPCCPKTAWIARTVCDIKSSFLDRTFWKGVTCVTPSKSCSRSSSHPSRPTARPAQRRPPLTQPHSLQTPRSRGPTRSRHPRASSPTTHRPVMETPRPHPFQTATLLDSSLVSWVKVREYLFVFFHQIECD